MSVCHHVAHGQLLKTQNPAVDLVLLWSLCQNKENLQARQEKLSRLCPSLNWTTVSMWLPAGVLANPEEAAAALLLGAALLEMRSSWRSEPPSSPFVRIQLHFFFRIQQGHYITEQLKRLCPGTFWKRYRGAETQSSQFFNLMKLSEY